MPKLKLKYPTDFNARMHSLVDKSISCFEQRQQCPKEAVESEPNTTKEV